MIFTEIRIKKEIDPDSEIQIEKGNRQGSVSARKVLKDPV